MLICLFVLKYALFVLVFMALGYILGKLFLRSNISLQPIESVFFHIIFGWGTLSILIMILGFSGIFYKPVLSSLLVSIIFLFLFLSKRRIISQDFLPARNNFTYGKSAVIIYSLISVYFFLLFYTALFPVTEFDATLCHLPIAQHFINEGSFKNNPFIRYDSPYAMNMFFVFSLMFGDDISASLTQYAMVIALCVLIYFFGKRYIGKNAGLLSMVIFICSPLVSHFSAVPYIEAGAALFCFAGFYAMTLWIQEKKLKLAIIGSLFWGIAIGSKYYSILFFIIAFSAIVISGWKRISKPAISVIILIVVLIACPWYMRNKHYTGDAFFPMLLNEENNKGLWKLNEARYDAIHIQNHGCGKDIYAFFLLPVNLLSHSDKFGGPTPGIFIIASFLSVIFLRKMPREIKAMFIISALYGFAWFKYFPVIRYLFPVLPFLALLSAWILDRCSFLKDKRFAYIIITLVLISGFSNILRVAADKGKIPFTAEEKKEYLRRYEPTYGAIDYLNKMAGHDVVVYVLYDEGSFYFHKNKVMGDWFGPARYSDIYPYLEQPSKEQDFIKKYGIKYILVKKRDYFKFSSKDKFKVIYEDKNSFIIDVFK